MRNGIQDFLAIIFREERKSRKGHGRQCDWQRKVLALSVFGLGASMQLGLAFTAEAKTATNTPQAEYIPGELVVKLKNSRIMSNANQKAGLQRSLAAIGVTSITPFQTDSQLVKMRFSGVRTMSAMIRQIQRNSNVEYAEPNYIYRASPLANQARVVIKDLAQRNARRVSTRDFDSSRMPADPDFGKNWGLLNTGQADSGGQAGVAGADIDATLAWNTGVGTRDVLVAIIDTGVDYNHPDLVDNIWTNTAEVPNNGIDDDHNGFVDDVHGYNFQGKTGDPMDDNKHGTHCAGTIGAVGDNGIGTAGVSWRVSMMGIKFLSASGSGSLDAAVESIKYATKMRVNIMSNSWGGGGYSRTLEDAIKEARNAGILFVAAAGNEKNNNDNRRSYPASYDVDNIISVAASDNRDIMASFSNYGARTVHLSAPGVRIYSTVPGGRYDSFSGTSMATPHVSGAAALLWSLNRGWSFANVRERLLATVDPIPALASKTISGGRLNINNAINNIVQPKLAPEEHEWSTVAELRGSKHYYDDYMNEYTEITYPGARFIRVHFTKVAVEADYDFVRVVSPNGEEFDSLTGEVNDHTSNFVPGDKLLINLMTDASNTDWGWEIDRIDYIM